MSDRIKIDIVSDVVCPWCIIGYKRLERAISEMEIDDRVEIEWHPFELNPHMPPAGEEIIGHLSKKYGITREESIRTLKKMADLGEESGFEFDFFDGMKMVNTRDVHILLDFARTFQKQTALKIRLFEAFFRERKNISDRQILAGIAEAVGLESVLSHIDNASSRDKIKAKERKWLELGVTSVPTMVFNGSGLLRGAQPVDIYRQILKGVKVNVFS